MEMRGKQGHDRGIIPMKFENVRPDARWILRDGTRDLHDRAETALGGGPMQRVEDYIAMLRANLDMTETVVCAVEPHLPGWLTSGLDRDRMRLRTDLADLGATCSPHAATVSIADRAGAMGAVYVCEGARLGGRVLARQVQETLGLTADHGAAYLGGEGGDTGARWRGFVDALNRDLARPDDLDRALLAARSIFALIIKSYEEA